MPCLKKTKKQNIFKGLFCFKEKTFVIKSLIISLFKHRNKPLIEALRVCVFCFLVIIHIRLDEIKLITNPIPHPPKVSINKVIFQVVGLRSSLPFLHLFFSLMIYLFFVLKYFTVLQLLAVLQKRWGTKKGGGQWFQAQNKLHFGASLIWGCFKLARKCFESYYQGQGQPRNIGAQVEC